MVNFKNIQIFCDFDGTITKEDTIKNFLNTFTGNRWLEIEKDWIDNKIGSLECLEKQLALVSSISECELNEFIDTVEIDDYFYSFYQFVKQNNIDFYIISDGLDYFIKKILSANSIDDVSIHSNHLEIVDNKMEVTFPNQNTACKRKSGTCKCSIANKYKRANAMTVYIGDGLSDCCVSDSIDFILAKEDLLKYCKDTNKSNYKKFEDFGDVLSELQRLKGESYVRA